MASNEEQDFTRSLESTLEDAVDRSPATLIVGPRQAGKSTLAQKLVVANPKWNSITLDDPIAYDLAVTSPQEFLKTYREPLFIDEIQRSPQLLRTLKLAIDRDRKPGRFLLTGSSNVLTLPKVSDSLAGRVEVIDLMPLTQFEWERKPDLNLVEQIFETTVAPKLPKAENLENELSQRVFAGGFPEMAKRKSPTGKRAWHASYLRSILDRDIKEIAHIEHVHSVYRLLHLIALRTNENLNSLALSRESGIPESTLRRYLDHLSRLFLTQAIPSWLFSNDSRIQKSPKIMLSDSGLACHLLGNEVTHLYRNQDPARSLLTGFTANEFQRHIANFSAPVQICHLRTIRNKSVDLVLEHQDGRIFGIDCSLRHAPDTNMAEGLRYLAELAGERFKGGFVFYLGSESAPIGAGLWAVPYTYLWCQSE